MKCLGHLNGLETSAEYDPGEGHSSSRKGVAFIFLIIFAVALPLLLEQP